jgi:acyl carrier protein
LSNVSQVDIANQIVDFVISSKAPYGYDASTLPKDSSLVGLGILDSYGVIEIIDFLEDTWSVTIYDEEVTTELLGSINKMSALVYSKIE